MRPTLLAVVVLSVPFAVAAPVPKDETPATKFARLFGEAKTPDDGCKAELVGDALRISAGGTGHSWNAGAGGMKVPYVVQEVAGDFVMTVKVKAIDLPDAGSVTGVAGVFVMKDETITMDHSLYLTGNKTDANRRGWLRVTSESNQTATKEDTDEAFKDDEVALKVERVGDKVTASVGSVGKPWSELGTYDMPMGKNANVGLFVAHADGPFAAEFRDFKITRK